MTNEPVKNDLTVVNDVGEDSNKNNNDVIEIEKEAEERIEHHTLSKAHSEQSVSNDVDENLQKNNNDVIEVEKREEEVENSERHTLPKVDRYGFLKSHRLHDKVKSLPNPALTSAVGQRREQKWLHMFHNWDVFISKRQNKVRQRCQKGIPQSIRSLAWQQLCCSEKMHQKDPDLFNRLLNNGDTKWSEMIRKDIPRTFRHHSMFSKEKGLGAEGLYQVLHAYSCYDTEVGYNQALAPVAAVLLMHMPPDESFWALVSLCKYYVPGYYGMGMDAMRMDGLIFAHLLAAHVPHVSRHMNEYNIDPLMYIVEWMVCMFARCLPFQTVLRIWDMFFCEGVKVLFKVGLAILKLTFPTEQHLQGRDEFNTTQILLDLPEHVTMETVLLPTAQKINISEKEFQRVHQKVYKENPDLSIKRHYSTTIKID